MEAFRIMLNRTSIIYTLILMLGLPSVFVYTKTRNKKQKTHRMVNKSVPTPMQEPAKGTPQDTVIVSDLHDVLLKFEFKKFWRSFKKHPHKFTSLGKMIGYKLGDQKQSIEHTMLSAQKDGKNTQTTLDLINAHSLKKGTYQLLNKARSQGFMLFAFSNLGELSFDSIKKQYPELANNFFTSMYLPGTGNKHATKKSPDTFRNFAHKSILPLFIQKHGHAPTRIILIDDSKTKLAAAQKGFDALKRSRPDLANATLATVRYKNCAQLRQELQKLITLKELV